MGKKKSEQKKPKLTLRKVTQINKEIEFQGKLDRLVDFFHQETPRLTNLKTSKLAILTFIYYEFKSVHDAYFASHNEKYKGKFKVLFRVNEKINSPNSGYADPEEQAKKIFEFPDDLLVSIFSSFLSPKWTPVKDPTDVLILLEVILVYTLYLEKLTPRPAAYQMNTATINLIWDALMIMKDLDKNGWNSDRTHNSTQAKRDKSENRKKRIIASWNKLQEKKGPDLISQMTRNRIATWIKNDLKKSSHRKEHQASTNIIIPALKEYVLMSKEPPPWKKG